MHWRTFICLVHDVLSESPTHFKVKQLFGSTEKKKRTSYRPYFCSSQTGQGFVRYRHQARHCWCFFVNLALLNLVPSLVPKKKVGIILEEETN